MAVITKIFEIVIRDSTGSTTTGKTVTFYPAGTVSNGTNATDNSDGSYTVEIDPDTDGGNVIDRQYDIYWDSTLQIEDFEAGWWEFWIDVDMDSDSKTVTYSSNSDLPSPIPNAQAIAIPQGDRRVYIDSISDTALTLKLGAEGTYEVNASNTLTVTLLIKGG